MKILIAQEICGGRDGQYRIQTISKLLKENYPEAEIYLVIKNSHDLRLYNSRYIEKIIPAPTDHFHSFRGGLIEDHVKETFLKSKSDFAKMMRFWDSIFNEINPNIVISDSAPSSAIASILRKIPCIQVSDGYHHLQFESVTNEFKSILESISEFKFDNNENHTIIVNSPVLTGIQYDFVNYAHIDSEKDDDGGLPIDIFAYIKRSDPLSNQILDALDSINSNLNKSILVVMNGIEPVFYKDNFELTPHFVRLQGALCSSPIVIQNFGTGLLLESIKYNCPVWGVPLNKDQVSARSRFIKASPENYFPTSKDNIMDSLMMTIDHKDELRENSKKLWNASIKAGIQPLSAVIMDKFRSIF